MERPLVTVERRPYAPPSRIVAAEFHVPGAETRISVPRCCFSAPDRPNPERLDRASGRETRLASMEAAISATEPRLSYMPRPNAALLERIPG
jgi:hypothetical protein